jgi:hypothetical protein
MAVYVIKRKNRNKKIVSFAYDGLGYEFKPNIKSLNLVKISNLYMMDEVLIEKILIEKMNKSFRKLTAIVLSILNDDDTTSGDVVIALDEIAKEKSAILKKYCNYLKKEEYEKMLKRLKLYEEDLKKHLICIKEQENNNFTR